MILLRMCDTGGGGLKIGKNYGRNIWTAPYLTLPKLETPISFCFFEKCFHSCYGLIFWQKNRSLANLRELHNMTIILCVLVYYFFYVY
jgi:hypothetical protein